MCNGPLLAIRETIQTIEENDVVSTGKSFACCEQIYQKCKKKDYCEECGHCACLPHCCCSDDCIALCKDDVASYCPIVREVYMDSDLKSAVISAVIYPAAHFAWHFKHAQIKRAASIESKKME